MKISIRYVGRNYQYGEQFPESLDLPDSCQLSEALQTLKSQVGDLLPESSLVIVGGEHLGSVGNCRQRTLSDGDELEFLAPVAGG